MQQEQFSSAAHEVKTTQVKKLQAELFHLQDSEEKGILSRHTKTVVARGSGCGKGGDLKEA